MSALPFLAHLRGLGAALEPDCAAVRVRREQLAPGDAGIVRTLRVMRELVQVNRGLPVVRGHYEAAVTGAPIGDPVAEVAAVHRYLARRVEYRQDPNGVEWLQAPWVVLACQIDRGLVPQLDCDDLTDLELAVLESGGHRTAFRVVSHRPDRQFNHVYGLALVGDLAVKLDLVEVWRPAGARPPAETRSLEMEVG